MPTQKDIYNPSGTTPEEMSQKATELSDIARSRAIGTRIPAGMSSLAEKTASTIQDSSLTSAPAKEYVLNLKGEAVTAEEYAREQAAQDYATSGQVYSDIKSPDPLARLEAKRAIAGRKESELKQAAREARGEVISTASKQAYISQLPPEEPNETEQEKVLRSIVQEGGGRGMSAGQALSTLNQMKLDKAKFAKEREKLTEQQGETAATARVGAFRYEQAGTPYATAAMDKIKKAHNEQLGQFDGAVANYLNEAYEAARRGSFSQAEKLRAEADRTFEQRLQIEQLAQQEVAQMLKAREYEDTRALKAQDKAMNTVQNLASAGFTVDQLPESYLAELDLAANMPKGFSRQIFETSKSAQEAQALEDVETRKAKEIENAKKIVDIVKSLPKGQSISIAGIEYSGLDVGNLKSGMEMDQNTGMATAWSFNPTTGEVVTTPMGNIGTAKDGFETRQLPDGSLWRVNPKTGAAQPFYASVAQTTWNATFPEGTPGPILPGGDPSNIGQCAAAVNYWYGERLLGDTFQEKQNALKSHEINKDQIKVGSTFLESNGTTGHVGIINAIEYGPDGKRILKFTESNYIPPGNGLVSHSRTMDIDDPRIKMFADIPTPNLPLAGTDSSATQVATGNAPTAILGAGMKEAVKPPTEAEKTTAGYANRLDESIKTMESLESDINKMGTVKMAYERKAPNWLKSSVMQQQEQAERNFVNAVLRRESGAAIAESEFENAKQQYFPQPGDSRETMIQKKRNRQTAFNNLIKSAGTAYERSGEDIGSAKNKYGIEY